MLLIPESVEFLVFLNYLLLRCCVCIIYFCSALHTVHFLLFSMGLCDCGWIACYYSCAQREDFLLSMRVEIEQWRAGMKCFLASVRLFPVIKAV